MYNRYQGFHPWLLSVSLSGKRTIYETYLRAPGRFPDHWTQIAKPRHIIQQIAEQDRSPVITNFLAQLAADRERRLAAKRNK